MKNIDVRTVEGFGDEWSRFDQSGMLSADTVELFKMYFSIFPWDSLPLNPEGFDLGCGSGRWAALVAPRVGKLHLIDPSDAIYVAQKKLNSASNCIFHKAGVDDMSLNESSMDFGYSLGVLHHVPDTRAALKACISKLKPGAPFLLYLYYAFDNRPFWFFLIWKISDLFRRLISRMPHSLRYFSSQIIAALIYWPMARLSKLLENIGLSVKNFPLSFYRNHGFYVMRTDALDRFGTRLEQRFTKDQIDELMRSAGLTDIEFSKHSPYWCAVGYKRAVF